MTKKTKINSEEFVTVFCQSSSAEEVAEHFGVEVEKVYSYAAYLRKHVGVELPTMHSLSQGKGRRRGRPSQHDKVKLNELVSSLVKKRTPTEKAPETVEVSTPPQSSRPMMTNEERKKAFLEARQRITNK